MGLWENKNQIWFFFWITESNSAKEKCLLANPSWVAVFIEILGNKLLIDSSHPIGRNWMNQSESAVTEAVWRLVRAIEPQSTSWILELVAKKSNFGQIATLAMANKNRHECMKTLVQLSEDEIIREKISENLSDWLPHLNDSIGHRLVLKNTVICRKRTPLAGDFVQFRHFGFFRHITAQEVL